MLLTLRDPAMLHEALGPPGQYRDSGAASLLSGEKYILLFLD